MAQTILVVEDEPALLSVLEATLTYGGFEMEQAESGRAALEVFGKGHFDAIFMDLGLPDLDGADLIQGFRAMTDIPILVVSGRGTERDKIEALDLGADDFIPKPFLPGELLARLRAALRRHALTKSPSGAAQNELTVDLATNRVSIGGRDIRLTRNEYKLIAALAAEPDGAVPNSVLLSQIWGSEDPRYEQHLRVLINQLRRKLEDDSSLPRYILNEHGVGYRLNMGE